MVQRVLSSATSSAGVMLPVAMARREQSSLRAHGRAGFMAWCETWTWL
jgi:hypothetical protein